MDFNKIRPSDIDATTKINDWKTYAYEYGVDNGLNEIEAQTFSDMINCFISKQGVMTNDNKYFKIQKMQFDIFAALPDIKELDTIEDQAKTLFDFIFIMFNEKVYEYTKKSEKISFRLTKKQYDDFMSVPGKDKADKLQTLLSSYYPPTIIVDDRYVSPFTEEERKKITRGLTLHALDMTKHSYENSNFKRPSAMDALEKALRKRCNCSDEVREHQNCGEYRTEYKEWDCSGTWTCEDYCNMGHDLEDTNPNSCKDYWDKS